MANLDINTRINGKRVLGISGVMAFLENGSFHYLTNEKIDENDFCGAEFSLPSSNNKLESEDNSMSDEQKKSNYRGKNFDPNYKSRFNKNNENLETKSNSNYIRPDMIIGGVEQQMKQDELLNQNNYIENKINIPLEDLKNTIEEIQEKKDDNVKIVNSTTKLVKKNKIKTPEEIEQEEFIKHLNYSGEIKTIKK